jgi:hypothetical protein
MLAGLEEELQGMKSIRILLAHAIDYAGLFPPAGLAMDAAVRNYEAYREGRDSWALGRFVVPLMRAEKTGLPSDLMSVVAGGTETAGAFVYLEKSVGLLDEVGRVGARAKVRTGGVTPDLFPTSDALANFLVECARRKLAFKATAGLHHAIRSRNRLTYEPDSASATMHGFLNVLLAASLAWFGGSLIQVCATLEESDSGAFQFHDAGASWHGHGLLNAQLATAREEFIASFGSCSFEEPMQELRELQLV